MDIIKQIGIPAMLEQLAEECAELSQAALKLARLRRGENPTPKTEGECLEALIEEIADVELCISELTMNDFVDYKEVMDIIDQKEKRWLNRLKEQFDRKAGRQQLDGERLVMGFRTAEQQMIDKEVSHDRETAGKVQDEGHPDQEDVQEPEELLQDRQGD